MTARAFSEVCARCDGAMVVTRDAIGRPRLRCPKCDGVSHNRRHPDEVLLPQGLVHLATALPPVRPGQLRCQRCARGVEGKTARLCPACILAARRVGPASRRTRPVRLRGTLSARAYAAKACLRCGLSFQPAGPNSRYCEGCR